MANLSLDKPVGCFVAIILVTLFLFIIAATLNWVQG